MIREEIHFTIASEVKKALGKTFQVQINALLLLDALLLIIVERLFSRKRPEIFRETLVEFVNDNLACLSISLKDCIGGSFDGATNM